MIYLSCLLLYIELIAETKILKSLRTRMTKYCMSFFVQRMLKCVVKKKLI